MPGFVDRPVIDPTWYARALDAHEGTIVPRPLDPPPADLSRFVAHVPVARFVELDCDRCLRQLEARGVQVDRSKGASAIDMARTSARRTRC